MRTPKVMVFCLTNLAKMRGGVLCTRNLLSSLAKVTDVKCVVVSSGPADARVANEEFVRSLGFEHIFVPVRKKVASGRKAALERLAAVVEGFLSALRDKYYFVGERGADMQRHIDNEVVAIIRDERPSLVIVNDIWSAIYVPSVFSLTVPHCLIVTDNEVAFHRAFRSHGGPVGKDIRSRLERWIVRNGNWLANRRFHNYVNSIYKHCNGIVALNRADLPTDLPSNIVQAVLPPLLHESTLRWRYQESRCVLFVGNVAHFANRLAVEWICSQLAPKLYRLDRRIRINIIGFSADQVRSGSKLENTNWLGEADQQELILHMTSDDLFIAPIANNFGAKLKLAECASYGMPFLATGHAMSGLPFLTFIPRIDLARPGAAARLIVEHVNRPEALMALSNSITERMRQARADQIVEWSAFLSNVIGNVPNEMRVRATGALRQSRAAQ